MAPLSVQYSILTGKLISTSFNSSQVYSTCRKYLFAETPPAIATVFEFVSLTALTIFLLKCSIAVV